MITNKNFFLAFLTICLCIVSESCSTSENEVIEPAKYTINGKIEKGPFVNGSSIDLQPMNAKMNALGSTYSATILDNAGNFSFGSKEIESPYVTFTANGYFYNEVEGELSNGPLTLKAIVNLADKSTVNVNLLTHLKYQRILNLISAGKSFNKTNAQAQSEILTAFGLQKYKDTDVSQYSIVTGTDEAGALIAISSLLLTYRSEAEFTEYLAKISNEFAQNGTFSENTINQMREDRKKLKLSTINEYLVSRYKELGVSISVKDLKYYFDWNNDGIAGNEFASDDVKLDVSEINVPQEGGSYRININTSMEVTLTKDDSEDFISISPSLCLYYNPIIHKESIEDHILKVEIQPTKYKSTKPLEINIYNYVGEIVATLTVKQAGNPLGDLLTSDGSMAISSIGESLSKAINSYNTLEAKYTQIIQDNTFKAPLSSENNDLNNSWKLFYQAIRRITYLSEIDQKQGGYIQAPLNTLFALCYYDMVTFWNDVVYYEKPSSLDNYDIPRTEVNTILTNLETKLKESINTLDNKKNTVVTNAEDFIFFSKDVPRILLANIYMYQNKYNEAKALLQNVVSNGYYQLESEKTYSSSNKELIFGLFNDDNNKSIMPVLTYSDVILSLSECEYNLGNIDLAKDLLDQVVDKKGITVSSDVLTGIKEARKDVISNNGGYFSFLKRNNLAISELELEKYQLLFPIPWHDVFVTSTITQNPGY